MLTPLAYETIRLFVEDLVYADVAGRLRSAVDEYDAAVSDRG